MRIFAYAIYLFYLLYADVKGILGIRIPSRPLGPSGKPMQHFIQKNNRKDALEAAKQQGRGRPPIHHNEKGRKSHFHPSNSDGTIRKDGSHFQYGKKRNR